MSYTYYPTLTTTGFSSASTAAVNLSFDLTPTITYQDLDWKLILWWAAGGAKKKKLTKKEFLTQASKALAGSPYTPPQESLQVIRRPAPLNFNKFINASDLMEDFVRFLGENDVKKKDALSIPIESFVKWLIIRACEEDQEEPNITLQLPAPRRQTRCLGCQRFLKEGVEIPIHDERCYIFYQRRKNKI